MLEGVLLDAGKRKLLVAEDQLARLQGRERPGHGGHLGREPGYQVIPELPARDRRPLEHEPLLGRQRIQAGLEHCGQCGRQAHLPELVRVHPPLVCPTDDCARLDERLDQFFEEEGVALRIVGQQGKQALRRVGHALQDFGGKRYHATAGERPEVDTEVCVRPAAPPRPALEQLGPGRD